MSSNQFVQLQLKLFHLYELLEIIWYVPHLVFLIIAKSHATKFWRQKVDDFQLMEGSAYNKKKQMTKV